MNKCLLTGATGVVGSAVLKKILLHSDDGVNLLIRGSDSKEKLKLVFKFLNLDFSVYQDRIQIINAAIEDKHYNLEIVDFQNLAESISAVFHCAASVDLMQDQSEAMQQSTAAMENIFELLRINPQIKLEHVSTVGVNGRSGNSLTEARIDTQRLFFNSYELTKARVEELIYAKMDQGFKINIHRPSMVVGEKLTGRIIHFQIFYFLLRLFSGELTFGLLPPILHRKLDTIPSDFVAEVLFNCSRTTSLNQKIIHHCSGPDASLTFEQIQIMYNQIKAQFNLPKKKITILPVNFFENTAALASFLPLGEKWKTRLQLVPQLLSYAQQDQIFQNQSTRELFLSTKWPMPQQYLEQSIVYYLKQRFKISGEN
jgi:thioester reductase-like protein